MAKLPYEFDGDPANLRLFLQVFRQRVDEFGWEKLIENPDSNNINRNLISEYGLLTMAQVQAKATTHVNVATRVAQNSVQWACFEATNRGSWLYQLQKLNTFA